MQHTHTHTHTRTPKHLRKVKSKYTLPDQQLHASSTPVHKHSYPHTIPPHTQHAGLLRFFRACFPKQETENWRERRRDKFGKIRAQLKGHRAQVMIVICKMHAQFNGTEGPGYDFYLSVCAYACICPHIFECMHSSFKICHSMETQSGPARSRHEEMGPNDLSVT